MRKEAADRKKAEEAEREAKLEASRTLNDKDLQGVAEAVSKGLREFHDKNRDARGFVCLIIAILLTLGAVAEGSVIAAIYAAVFIWLAFRR